MMAFWVVPHIAWCVHGTGVSLRDILAILSRPFVSGVAAGALTLALQFFYGYLFSPLPRLALGGVLFLVVYVAMLLGVMGQRAFYLDLLRGFRQRSPVGDEALASA
jgi:PST family polysaccharide transporter